MADFTSDSDAIDPSQSQNPMDQAALYNAKMAGVLNGLSTSSFNDQQRQQLAANSADLMQKATHNLVGNESPLRKLSHVIGGVLQNAGMGIAGASSGNGFEAVRDMMVNSRRQHDAEEAKTVMQLKAAHQAAQMGTDPKMISNILNGYKSASKGAVDLAKEETNRKKQAAMAANAINRNAIAERIAGVREGQLTVNQQRADANDMNALTNQQYKSAQIPIQQQRANAYDKFAGAAQANAGTNAYYKGGMLDVNQQRANTDQSRQGAQSTHYGNMDTNSANRNSLEEIIKPHTQSMNALKPILINFEKTAMKRELTPEEEAQYQAIQQTYEGIANDAYAQTQSYNPAPIQQQPQPVGMSAGPAGALNAPQQAPQAAPHQQPRPQQQHPQQMQHQQPAPTAAPQQQAFVSPPPPIAPTSAQMPQGGAMPPGIPAQSPQQQPHFQQQVQNLASRARQLFQQSGGKMTVQQALMAAKQQMGGR